LGVSFLADVGLHLSVPSFALQKNFLGNCHYGRMWPAISTVIARMRCRAYRSQWKWRSLPKGQFLIATSLGHSKPQFFLFRHFDGVVRISVNCGLGDPLPQLKHAVSRV
jgi:hypothetical protein